MDLKNKIIKFIFILYLINIKNVSAKIIETPETSYNLDLVGLLITFGDSGAITRLWYQLINRDKWILLFTVTPGIYTWLEIIYNLFIIAKRKDKSYELYSKDKIKYTGIFSNTRTEIKNIASEEYIKNIINEPKANKKYRRPTNLQIIQLNKNPDSEIKIKQPIIEWWWLWGTIITILLIIILGLMEDWFGISVIIIHFICNIMIHILSLNGNIYWSKSEPSKIAPNGDCFIEINNSILLIKGSENLIQKFLQKPLIYKNKSNIIYIGITWLVILISLCWTVLGSPLATTQGQYCLGASLIIGLIVNIQISYENNGKNWRNICIRDFGIKQILEKTFKSRSTALGVIVALSESNPNILLGNELPNTKEWEEWCNILKNEEYNDNINIKQDYYVHDSYSSLKFIKKNNICLLYNFKIELDDESRIKNIILNKINDMNFKIILPNDKNKIEKKILEIKIIGKIRTAKKFETWVKQNNFIILEKYEKLIYNHIENIYLNTEKITEFDLEKLNIKKD